MMPCSSVGRLLDGESYDSRRAPNAKYARRGRCDLAWSGGASKNPSPPMAKPVQCELTDSDVYLPYVSGTERTLGNDGRPLKYSV